MYGSEAYSGGGGYGEINKSPHGQIPQYASRK